MKETIPISKAVVDERRGGERRRARGLVVDSRGGIDERGAARPTVVVVKNRATNRVIPRPLVGECAARTGAQVSADPVHRALIDECMAVEIVLIGGGAIGLDIEGHQSLCVGYIERLFIAAERHAVRANVLACDEADLAGGIDEVGAIVVGEVDAALGIADEFAHAPECLAVVFAGQCRMLLALFDDDHLRRLMALVGMAARIRAGALNADDAALVVDAESSGAVSVRGKDGEFVRWIEPANGAGLLLRK